MVKSHMRSRRNRKGPGVKKHTKGSSRHSPKHSSRHSPRRTPSPSTVKAMRQKRQNPSRLKTNLRKTFAASSRIKLIDANPRTKFKKVGSPSVIYLTKDSKSRQGRSIRTAPVISSMKIGRAGRRFLNHSKAREGVDFFSHLGQRVLKSKPGGVADQKWLRAGQAGLTQAIVHRARPMPSRLGTLCSGPVYNSSASGASARNLVVPLTNRLPIIDFISTNEFNQMNETLKMPRRQGR